MKMPNPLFLLFLLFALCVPASVQAGPHSVALSFTASPVTGVSYHVQRAPCSAPISAGVCPSASEGTFAIIATITTLTYTDTTVVGNTNYSYAVSAFCPTSTSCPSNFIVNQDSALSNHVGAAIPPDPVTPPSNLVLTSVTRNSTGANTTITASWTDTPGTTTTYSVLSNGNVVSTSTAFSTTGQYNATWAGKIKPGNSITFLVCDTAGCVSR